MSLQDACDRKQTASQDVRVTYSCDHATFGIGCHSAASDFLLFFFFLSFLFFLVSRNTHNHDAGRGGYHAVVVHWRQKVALQCMASLTVLAANTIHTKMKYNMKLATTVGGESVLCLAIEASN